MARRADEPLVVIDMDKPYIRKGLVYVPIEAIGGPHLIIGAPHIILKGAHAVLAAVTSEVLDFRPKGDHRH